MTTFRWPFQVLAKDLNPNDDYEDADHPRGQPSNSGQFATKPGTPKPKVRPGVSKSDLDDLESDEPAPKKGPEMLDADAVSDLIKTPPGSQSAAEPVEQDAAVADEIDPPLTEGTPPTVRPQASPPPEVVARMKAQGDVYGHFIPAGKYAEGDPRNDPEFERVHNDKRDLTERYVGVSKAAIDKAIEKGKSPEKIAQMRAVYDLAEANFASGKGGETERIHDRITDPTTGANTYTVSRQALHDSILDEYRQKASTVPRDGKCLIMAGPSGAGKSTFIKQHPDRLGIELDAKGQPTNFITVNPDDFKEHLPVDPARYPGLDPNEMAGITHEESSYLCKRAVKMLMSQGYNVIIDITLGNARKAMENYVEPYERDYTYQVALVNGDMKNSFNNAGLRYKKPDNTTGERTYEGRYVSMDLVASQAPTEDGYRSLNAQEFDLFRADSRVDSALVYDPFLPEDDPKKVAEAPTGQFHSLGSMLGADTGMLRAEGGNHMGFRTTEITEKIKEHAANSLDREALVAFLTSHRYVADAPEVERGEDERYLHVLNGGDDYTPGGWDEVLLAYDTGLLPKDVFAEVHKTLAERGRL